MTLDIQDVQHVCNVFNLSSRFNVHVKHTQCPKSHFAKTMLMSRELTSTWKWHTSYRNCSIYCPLYSVLPAVKKLNASEDDHI
jgi:hypothetical protein